MRKYVMSACFAVLAASLSHQAIAQDTRISEMTEDEAFAAVYADPSNIALNFQLVAVQLRNNHIKEAAGTLERILILLPNNAQAQLLLARVQLQLGNKPEAKRLAGLLLENEGASESQKSEAAYTLGQIEDSESLINLSGTLSFGGGIADNPEGGSRGNRALATDIEGELTDKRANTEDFLTFAGNFNIRGNLVSQLPEAVTLNMTFSKKDYTQYNPGDTDVLGLSAGYAKNFQNGAIQGNISATRIHVGDRHYLNSYQVTANYAQSLGSQTTGRIGVSANRRVFKDSFSTSTTETEKTGLTSGINLGLSSRFDALQVSATVSAQDVDAMSRLEDKASGKFQLDLARGFSFGILSGGLAFESVEYDQVNSVYSSTLKRKDEVKTMTLGYVSGLGTFAPPRADETILRLDGRYAKADSNIQNFRKYSGEVSLTVIQPF
ncbi:MAG: tetratricopeptide repeat protein [Candidatus Puniceispirillaceae bacterium]